jgi:1,4-alpha-glucan branching enzyme
MKRRYNMPFGAECRDDGSVRFRLWAPAARQVELSLAGANRSMRLLLEPCDKGWFELATDAARPGTQYHFRIDGGQEVSDPASRFQPRDVHGPSEVIDPGAFDWQDLAVSMPMAKHKPWAPMIIAVLTPITSPRELTSGPPEFPGFRAASVCTMPSISRPD